MRIAQSRYIGELLQVIERLYFYYAFVTSIWNAQLTFKLGSSGLEPHWYNGSLLYYYSESQPQPFSFSFTSLLREITS